MHVSHDTIMGAQRKNAWHPFGLIPLRQEGHVWLRVGPCLQTRRTWYKGLHCPQRASTLVSCTRALHPTRKTATHLAQKAKTTIWRDGRTARHNQRRGLVSAGASGLAVGALTTGHQSHAWTWSRPCARGRDRGEARGIL